VTEIVPDEWKRDSHDSRIIAVQEAGEGGLWD
jgi:hypothetical protein